MAYPGPSESPLDADRMARVQALLPQTLAELDAGKWEAPDFSASNYGARVLTQADSEDLHLLYIVGINAGYLDGWLSAMEALGPKTNPQDFWDDVVRSAPDVVHTLWRFEKAGHVVYDFCVTVRHLRIPKSAVVRLYRVLLRVFLTFATDPATTIIPFFEPDIPSFCDRLSAILELYCRAPAECQSVWRSQAGTGHLIGWLRNTIPELPGPELTDPDSVWERRAFRAIAVNVAIICQLNSVAMPAFLETYVPADVFYRLPTAANLQLQHRAEALVIAMSAWPKTGSKSPICATCGRSQAREEGRSTYGRCGACGIGCFCSVP